MVFSAQGSEQLPITFKAETPGKVLITGHSNLKIGGSFLIVDGLYFIDGFAGSEHVISFCINKQQLANNCRVTNTVINNFNNPKRLNENYWVSFYGKKNRIDHCSFQNKKNLGVLMAVILEDDRSRENFHSIDHNYFGFRIPLASNAGEMIRIGVAEHCEFNSNTQITNNSFENCDGETEIISIKSGSNLIQNNLFKECQGAVVLRHGNYNTIENNVFLGNDKKGTGGVRVINKGQWVVNNFFYRCKGVGFRSPLSVMNGVPNSPALRYVAVSDAVIANNSFVECAPFSLCEGSDSERSETPHHVQFVNNLFFSKQNSILYKVYDNISGIQFSGNSISNTYNQQTVGGFEKTKLRQYLSGFFSIAQPNNKVIFPIKDSLQKASIARIKKTLQPSPGFNNAENLHKLVAAIQKNSGSNWYSKQHITAVSKTGSTFVCNTSEEINHCLQASHAGPVTIVLNASSYRINQPLEIRNNVCFVSKNQIVRFLNTDAQLSSLFYVKGNAALTLRDLKLSLEQANAKTVICTDTSGAVEHLNIVLKNSSFKNYSGVFLRAAKTSLADSIIIEKTLFENNKGILFSFSEESDKKGYYNVENLRIQNNRIIQHQGQLLTMLRSGSDESTLGPSLLFRNNTIEQVVSERPAIHLFGTQLSEIAFNQFKNCNTTGTILQYEDVVRAEHLLKQNSWINSGAIVKNNYVEGD